MSSVMRSTFGGLSSLHAVSAKRDKQRVCSRGRIKVQGAFCELVIRLNLDEVGTEIVSIQVGTSALLTTMPL